MQPNFGSVTALTPQSHRMAEAEGTPGVPLSQSLLRQGHLGPRAVTFPSGEVQACSAGAQGGAFPLPAALRMRNSPPMARAALDLHFGVSRAPLLAPVSPGGGIYHQSSPGASWIAPVTPPAGIRLDPGGAGPETCKFQPEAAPVYGGSDPLIFPVKHHLSLSSLHP